MELSDVTHNYWQSCWKNNDVRFHKLEPNEYLVAHKDVYYVHQLQVADFSFLSVEKQLILFI